MAVGPWDALPAPLGAACPRAAALLRLWGCGGGGILGQTVSGMGTAEAPVGSGRPHRAFAVRRP